MAVYRIGYFYGYLNEQGEEITAAKYGLAWDAKEGVARAAFRTGIGFLNQKGETILQPIYRDIRDFSEGLARAQLF